MFSWHDVRDDDLEECLQTSPRAIGHELVGWSRALTAWRSLLQSSSCIATAVEFSDRSAGCRIVAFGCSVFVSADFANGELADPKPGLASRLISSIDGGRSVVLTRNNFVFKTASADCIWRFFTVSFWIKALRPNKLTMR